MRKIAVLLAFLSFGLIFYTPVKAEVPSGIMGFQDGKYYDKSGNFKCLKFMDGSCYDMNQKLVFKEEATTPINQVTNKPAFTLLDIPNQFFPREVLDYPIGDMANFNCYNSQEKAISTLTCTNNTKYSAAVKGILFTMPYNSRATELNDYSYVNDNFSVYSNFSVANQLNFSSNSSNTLFKYNSDTKVAYMPPTPFTVNGIDKLTQIAQTISFKSVGGIPSLVLVNINGHDVVYKVN